MDLSTLLFIALFGLAIVWLTLAHWLARRLGTRHRSLHEEFGSFGLFENNTPRTNWLFAKFLFSSRAAETRDLALMQVCLVMRVLFALYLVIFLLLIANFFVDIPGFSAT